MSDPERPLRVLHLVKTPTGAAWALRQMRELVRAGCEVHVGLPLPSPLLGDYEAAGVRVHALEADLGVLSPLRWPAVFTGMRDLVGQVRPDIVHSHFVSTTLAARVALRRVALPRVFQVPGPLHLEHPLYRRLDVGSANALDYWIGSCRATVEHYRRAGVPSGRVHLSYYGTDLPAQPVPPRGDLWAELGLAPSTRLVGLVAYIYPPKRALLQTRGLKGHEDLIDALGRLIDQGHDVAGVFVGGTWRGAPGYEERLLRRAAARCADRAFFLGTRPEAHRLYPELDVAVHPSLSENVGGALESLMHAVPTVSTDVGGLPDLVRDGETGWLVPPRRPDRLAQAIAAALEDPSEARRRAEAGRRLVQELFDVRRTASQVLGIYRSILGLV